MNTQIYEWSVLIRTKSPLHIGDNQNEIMVDQRGRPLIPGTSLAGVCRAYMESSSYGELVSQLFGDGASYEPHKGLIFSDGVSREKQVYDIRTGVSISSETKTGEEGQLFERIFIPAETEFHAKLILKASKNESDKLLEAVDHMLHALHHGRIRIGAHQTIGGGRVEIQSCHFVHYDCSKEEDLAAYVQQSKQAEPYELPDDIQAESMISFTLQGKTETPLLIGTPSLHIEGEADLTFMKTRINGKEKPVIPGSSLKGVLRHRVERIANILSLPDKNLYMEQLFGHDKQSDVVKAGSVYFDDIVLEKPCSKIYYRTSINPLTGSVRSGALLNEEAVTGEFTLTLHFRYKQDDIKTNVSAALLLFALRDLALQELSIGSRSSIGYGFLDIEHIEIEKEQAKVHIDMDRQHIDDPSGLLTELDNYLEKASHKEGVGNS